METEIVELTNIQDVRKLIDADIPEIPTHVPFLKQSILPFKQVDSDGKYFCDILSSHLVNTSINMTYIHGSSELACSLLYHMCTGHIWQIMALLMPHLGIHFNMNTSDCSYSHTHSTRPDYCLRRYGQLLLKAEYKRKASQLEEARQELVHKLCANNGLSAPFLLCYAAAGPKIQFYAITSELKHGVHDYSTQEISKVFDLTDFCDRCEVMKISLNIVRLLGAQYSAPWKLQNEIGHERPNSIIYSNRSHILKECKPAKLEVYEALKTIDGAIIQVEVLKDAVLSLLGKSKSYQIVRITPVGKQIEPATELELTKALKDILGILKQFHDLGFVHRDIRWPNVLQNNDGRWFLIDFEEADISGAVIQGGNVADNYLPPESRGQQIYNTSGDIWQVGMLINTWYAKHHSQLSSEIQSMMTRMIRDDPKEHPSASVLLKDALFTNDKFTFNAIA